MLKKSALPLWVEVKQSNYLLGFIIALHSLAFFSALLLAVIMPLKILLLVFVSYSLYFHLLRYRQGFYLLTLKHTTEFSWERVEKNSVTGMRILNSSVLTSQIIILHVKMDKKSRNLLILKDAVSAEAFRQLLVTLKITVAGDSTVQR